MSVRKRIWTTPKGEPREAWLADYTGADGVRHTRQFDRRKDADAFIVEAKVEVRKGTHTADFDSVTVAEAAEKWLATCVERELERTSVRNYEIVSRRHICPLIGSVKLSRLTAPMIREFEGNLLATGRTPKQTRVAMAAMSCLISDAMERGLVARNVLRELGSRRKGVASRLARRQAGKLEVGVDIPTRGEIKAIVDSLQGFWRPIIITAIFTGLRASELRGLRWVDVDLANAVLHVRQRADCFKAIGPPKSLSGVRTVPLYPLVLNTLRQHKLQSRGELVFTTEGAAQSMSHTDIRVRAMEDLKQGTMRQNAIARKHGISSGLITRWAQQLRLGQTSARGRWPGGGVLSLAVIIESGWQPIQVAAGVVKPDGTAKYSGLHCLRHFYASWCINAVEDGGHGLSAKVLQTRLGHATIGMTLDVYSHLFPAVDESERGAAAERSLLG